MKFEPIEATPIETFKMDQSEEKSEKAKSIKSSDRI